MPGVDVSLVNALPEGGQYARLDAYPLADRLNSRLQAVRQAYTSTQSLNFGMLKNHSAQEQTFVLFIQKCEGGEGTVAITALAEGPKGEGKQVEVTFLPGCDQGGGFSIYPGKIIVVDAINASQGDGVERGDDQATLTVTKVHPPIPPQSAEPAMAPETRPLDPKAKVQGRNQGAEVRIAILPGPLVDPKEAEMGTNAITEQLTARLRAVLSKGNLDTVLLVGPIVTNPTSSDSDLTAEPPIRAIVTAWRAAGGPGSKSRLIIQASPRERGNWLSVLPMCPKVLGGIDDPSQQLFWVPDPAVLRFNEDFTLGATSSQPVDQIWRQRLPRCDAANHVDLARELTNAGSFFPPLSFTGKESSISVDRSHLGVIDFPNGVPPDVLVAPQRNVGSTFAPQSTGHGHVLTVSSHPTLLTVAAPDGRPAIERVVMEELR